MVKDNKIHKRGAIQYDNHNDNFEKQECKIQCKFGDAIRELQIGKLFTKSNVKGKIGKSFYDVFQFLLLLVFQNCNLLCLGTEFQGLSYDMTVSSTAIVCTRYILLEWLRRKKNDEKTICELFYVCCDDIQDMELSAAIKQLLAIFANGLSEQAITISKEIKSQLIDWFVSQPAFIQALCPDLGWEV